MNVSESLLDGIGRRPAQPPLVLLVDDEADVRTVYRHLLERGGTYRVLEAADAAHGLALARDRHPDIVISDLAMPGMDGFAFCAALKADPALEGIMFMILTGHNETHRRTAGLLLGVDDFVAKPAEAGELLARTRALVRQKRLADTLRAEHLELVAAKEQLARGYDQVLDLLGHLLDVARPGAGGHATRLADAADAVGRRCDIPAPYLRELLIAARLAPLAELPVDGPAAVHDGDVAADTGTPWRRMVAVAAVLARVPALAPVGALLNEVYENWDGTGQPGHAVKGQIALRARLLRVLLDFFALRDGGLAVDEALERLQAAAGTKYDPALVAMVGAWAREQPGAPTTRRYVPVEELAPGMELADDLFTAGGVLLMKGGAALNETMLGLIRRRHEADPILLGPYVRA